MNPPRRALIVFLRYPEAGHVKSRLAAAIGPNEAARVYTKLLRRTLGVVADFKGERPEVKVFIFFTPPEKKLQIEEAYPGPWGFACQRGTHLGERMASAIQEVLDGGHSQVLLVGTDVANLEPSDFDEAFEVVRSSCAALGPAADGGFYLIGLDRPCPSAFEPKTWGTGEIYGRTEQLLLNSGLQVKRLKERRDVDCSADLKFLEKKAWFSTSLSVIIPTLDPIDQLEPLLQRLQKQIWPDDEIIVAEAGRESGKQQTSDHGPKEITPQIITICAPRGRGLQLNRGAAVAKGNVLFFLHDDSAPPPNFAYAIRKICELPEFSLGCFHLAFSPSSPSLDRIARWANLRARVFGLPYGDQGLFCRREVYEKVGGFKKPFLMEDVDFVRNCRRLGRILVLPDRIATSPGRYVHKGVLRASLQNHLTMLLYRLGVSDRSLYSIYYRKSLR